MKLTDEDKKSLITNALVDPVALEAMFDALQKHREGLWESGTFVNRKRAALDFVRGIMSDELELLERAIEMVKNDHAFTKHFAALRDFTVVQNGKRVRVHADSRLEMVGHGWQKLPGHTTERHVLEIRNLYKEIEGKIDISHRTLSRLLDEDKIIALP